MMNKVVTVLTKSLCFVIAVTLFNGWFIAGSTLSQEPAQRIMTLTQRIDELHLTNDPPFVKAHDLAGAYKKNKDAAGFSWYFDTIGVYSIALDGKHDIQTREYLNTYLSHALEPGNAVVDYADVINNFAPITADSDDAYAATLLILASQQNKDAGIDGQTWFVNDLPKLKEIAKSNLVDTIDPVLNLTKTFNSDPDRKNSLPVDKQPYQSIMQFMDNCQSARGLKDFADQLLPSDSDKSLYETSAVKVIGGLRGQFNDFSKAFKWTTDASFNDIDQMQFYPGRLCQIFPQAFHVDFGDDTQALYDAGWAYLNARGDEWWQGNILDDSDRIDKKDPNDKLNYPRMIIDYVAALRGEYGKADAQLTHFLNSLPTLIGKDLVYGNIEELGWALQTARLLARPKTTGDVNLNGKVDVSDAVLALQYIVHLKSLSEGQRSAADVNKDGSVNIGDAVGILQIIVKIGL